MPDVVGLDQADAIAALEGAGFVVVVTTAASSTVPAGQVISQVPPGGSMATAGSTVTIVVSTGDVIPVNPLLIGGKKKKPNPNIKFKPPAKKQKKELATDESKPEPPKKRASGLFLELLARTAAPAPAASVVVKPDAPAVVVAAPAAVIVEAAPAAAAPAASAPAAPQPAAELVDRLMARIEELESALVDRLGALERQLAEYQHDLSLTLPAGVSEPPAPVPVARKLSSDELEAENLRRARILTRQLLG